MMNNLEFTFQYILLSFLGFSVFTIGLIVIMKYKLKLASRNLSKKPRINESTSDRTKYKEVNSFQYSSYFLKYGLVIAIGFSLSVISFTSFEKQDYTVEFKDDFEKDIIDMFEPPIFHYRRPPPPPPIIEPVLDLLEPVDDTPDLISDKVEINDMVIEPDKTILSDDTLSSVDSPVSIAVFEKPEPKEEIIEIKNFAEYMPRFPGCENSQMSNEDKKACAQNKLLKYLYKNISYPKLAQEVGIQGNVIVQFVVMKNGDIDQIKLLRDIGAGCGKEAIKAIEKMKDMKVKWTPGKHHGFKVNVKYTLPVKFKIEG